MWWRRAVLINASVMILNDFSLKISNLGNSIWYNMSPTCCWLSCPSFNKIKAYNASRIRTFERSDAILKILQRLSEVLPCLFSSWGGWSLLYSFLNPRRELVLVQLSNNLLFQSRYLVAKIVSFLVQFVSLLKSCDAFARGWHRGSGGFVVP